MSNYALVVIGYDRVPGMMRLLDSLERAYYGEEKVTLIISLDNCGNSVPEEAARAFSWSHGEKIVRTFPERQGLRTHILSCGDYLETYDAIAVFEDDLVVSPAFYDFMKQAVVIYQNHPEIAGISLYSHKINVNRNLPFVPQPDAYDNYFMQFAQSWGQVWMKEQWLAFKAWYEKHMDEPVEADNVPAFVSSWPKSSWLKYHIKYCIDQKKYFVYPYHSFTTCYSDAGVHCKESNTIYQVPMFRKPGMQYRFCEDLGEGICYDAFFERRGLADYVGVKEEELCVDFYGTKGNREKRRYWLTREQLPYKKIAGYDLCLRPQECNIIENIFGDSICLYDTQTGCVAEKDSIRKNHKTITYYYNITACWREILYYFVVRLKDRLKK